MLQLYDNSEIDNAFLLSLIIKFYDYFHEFSNLIWQRYHMQYIRLLYSFSIIQRRSTCVECKYGYVWIHQRYLGSKAERTTPYKEFDAIRCSRCTHKIVYRMHETQDNTCSVNCLPIKDLHCCLNINNRSAISDKRR